MLDSRRTALSNLGPLRGAAWPVAGRVSEAELGARMRVRKRVVSYGPRSEQGVKAWDTMETLLATAKKLGVNFFHYIRDRVSGAKKMMSLAELINHRARTVDLSPSWGGR